MILLFLLFFSAFFQVIEQVRNEFPDMTSHQLDQHITAQWGALPQAEKNVYIAAHHAALVINCFFSFFLFNINKRDFWFSFVGRGAAQITIRHSRVMKTFDQRNFTSLRPYWFIFTVFPWM